jgi:para-nitrobenzyl esterase
MALRYALTFASGLSISLGILAQDCSGGRYTTPLFPDVTVTTGVAFGSNTGVSGTPQTLLMDIYEPAGDVLEDRPVVLAAFGGSFVAGSRADMASLCTELARRGYVAIAPDYRIGFFLPNELSTTQAVMRGSHDMKACVRFLRRSVAEQGNPYRIDPDRIVVGGISAGAISALHATYLNEDEEIPAILASQSVALGGAEGNSGNPGFSSEVLACYSFSGAIGDTSWVVANDRPLCSVHEVGDDVVPYNTQEVSVFGIATGLIASGSNDLHIRLQNLGVPNCFLSYPDNDHVGYLTSDPATSLGFVFDFLADKVCGGNTSCGTLFASVAERELERLVVTPNPTADIVSFDLEGPSVVRVMDASGRIVMEQQVQGGRSTLDLGTLPDGFYHLRIEGAQFLVAQVVKAAH